MKTEKIDYFIKFIKVLLVTYKKCDFFRQIAFVIAFFSIASCTSLQAPQKSNLTPGIVKTKIQKGVTSQAEIVGLIGAPNIITKNRDGDEVWTYSRQSFDSESGGLEVDFFFWWFQGFLFSFIQ